MIVGSLYWRIYRLVMRIGHRYDWHYVPPIHLEGDTQLWCQWCGFRQTIRRSMTPDRDEGGYMPIGRDRQTTWAVMVDRDGDNIVTIGSSHLSGKADLSPEDEETIRTAAQHLLSFVGREAKDRSA